MSTLSLVCVHVCAHAAKIICWLLVRTMCVWLKIGASTGQTEGLIQADVPEGSVIFFFNHFYHFSVCICAFTSEHLSLQARKEEGVLAIFYVLCEFCWRQSLTGAGFVTCWVTVLSLHVSAFPWDMCSVLLPVETAKEKAAAPAPSLGRDLDPWTLGLVPEARQMWSRDKVAEEISLILHLS